VCGDECKHNGAGGGDGDDDDAKAVRVCTSNERRITSEEENARKTAKRETTSR